MAEPLPPERLVRGVDPRTSLDAAIKATAASRKAISAVTRCMADGCDRTDQEIREACRQMSEPYFASLSTVQHAHLALSLAGELLDTGARRQTEDGGFSIVWKKKA